MNRFRISGSAVPGFLHHSNRLGRSGAKHGALAAFLLVCFCAGCRRTPTYTGAPNLVVHIVMRKWAIVPNRIVVPQGAKVELIVTTSDVEHGMAIPGLAINEPVQPGWTTVVRFLAQRPGLYPARCSIACGRGHDDMTGEIVITPAPAGALTPVHK